MLKWDPRKRATADEILHHEFLNDYACKDQDLMDREHPERIYDEIETRKISLAKLRQKVVEEYFHYNNRKKQFLLRRLKKQKMLEQLDNAEEKDVDAIIAAFGENDMISMNPDEGVP